MPISEIILDEQLIGIYNVLHFLPISAFFVIMKNEFYNSFLLHKQFQFQ